MLYTYTIMYMLRGLLLDTYKKQRRALGICLVYSLYQAFSPLNSRYTSPY